MTIKTIKLSYGMGALADGVIGILLLLPHTLAAVLGLAEVPARVPERVALTMTAALLFGWTGLLLWGAHSPVERRGILPLTIFPVIAGLAAAVWLGWKEAYISTGGAAQVWGAQVLLSVLFIYAFTSAGRLQRSKC